jgi:hypothetical protein
MNMLDRLSQKDCSAEEKVILPPPPEDYETRHKVKIKPQKENKILNELLHKVNVWQDLVPMESVEEMIPVSIEDMEDLGDSPAYAIPMDAETIPAPKKAYSNNELVKLCDYYFDLASS